MITVKDWQNEAIKLFGENHKKWAFKCSNCGHVQTIEDFEKNNITEPEKKVYFSCIGRWLPDCQGELGNKKSPCNYTLGGLFTLDCNTVISNDGEKINVFHFAIEKAKKN